MTKPCPTSRAGGPGTVVHLGGPVGPDTVIVLARFGDPATRRRSCSATSAWSIPRPTPGSAGCAGVRRARRWGPGQLDDELEREAWIVETAQPDDPFEGGDLWSNVLDRKGGGYTLLARMPEDPSLN